MNNPALRGSFWNNCDIFDRRVWWEGEEEQEGEIDVLLKSNTYPKQTLILILISSHDQQ